MFHMLVSIVTFANLGRKTNLKTPDILPVINAFAKRKILSQVICQINSGFYFRETYSSMPVWVRYPFRAFEFFTRIQIPRRITEACFDIITARLITRSDYCILHGGYSLPRTFRKLRAAGSVLIDLAVVAHLKTNSLLEKEEIDYLGFPEFQGTYSSLANEVSHDNDFNYVIALSDFVKESYIRSGFPAERIYTAYPDIDIERFKPVLHKTPGVFEVVYVAYTTPLKGLHYLITAWNELALHDAKLTIVGGNGPAPLHYMKHLRMNTDRTVVWEESSSEPEKFYRNADVLVFPSLTEGFGRVTLEAMACGIPVITTENARGIVEEGKTGFVVPIRDVAALKDKIAYLYANREAMIEMGKQARLAVVNKKPFGEAVYEIYQEIRKREGL
jgi:glycosyltransferase involved in cell wall biosynthesis